MLFNDVSSLAELFAGISIAYAASDSFSGGFDQLIGNNPNKIRTTHPNDSYGQFVARRAYWQQLLHDANLRVKAQFDEQDIVLNEPRVDPLATKLLEMVKRLLLS